MVSIRLKSKRFPADDLCVPRYLVSHHPDFILRAAPLCVALLNLVLEFRHLFGERNFWIGQRNFEIDDEKTDLVGDPVAALCLGHPASGKSGGVAVGIAIDSDILAAQAIKI